QYAHVGTRRQAGSWDQEARSWGVNSYYPDLGEQVLVLGDPESATVVSGGEGENSYTVMWGDGTVETVTSTEIRPVARRRQAANPYRTPDNPYVQTPPDGPGIPDSALDGPLEPPPSPEPPRVTRTRPNGAPADYGTD